MARASSAFVRVFLSASRVRFGVSSGNSKTEKGGRRARRTKKDASSALTRRRGPLSSLRLFFNFHFCFEGRRFSFFSFFPLFFLLLASYYCQVVHLYRCASRAHPRGERGGGARACLGEREGEGEKGVIWGIRYSRALFFPRARAPTRSQKEWMGARESQENQGGGEGSQGNWQFLVIVSLLGRKKKAAKKKGEEKKKSSGSGGGGCPPARAARAARRDGQQKQQKQHTHTQGGRIFHSSGV